MAMPGCLGMQGRPQDAIGLSDTNVSGAPPVEPVPIPADREAVLPRGVVLGNYRVIALVGEGSMGRVYAAEHVTLRTRHALKVIRDQLAADERFLKRFRREARLMANLRHPHITHVTDFGVDHGFCYFVMDYVAGRAGRPETLQQLLDRSGKDETLDDDLVIRIFSQVVDALGYCHAFHDRGVVHRDLKPSNILLREEEGRPPQVVISDFGIAEICGDLDTFSTLATGSGKSSSSEVSGTPRYMSPEQWQVGNVVGPASDLFSVGVMLYQALTGEMPFADSRALMGPNPPKIRKPSRFGRSHRWDAIVDRCLATTPDHRYARAADLARDLARLRRHPWTRAAWAAGLACVAAVVAWWGMDAMRRPPSPPPPAQDQAPSDEAFAPASPSPPKSVVAPPVAPVAVPVSVQVRIAPGHGLPYSLPAQAELRVGETGAWQVVGLPHVLRLPPGAATPVALRVAGYEAPLPRNIEPRHEGEQAVFELAPLPTRVKVTSNAGEARVYEGDRDVGRVGDVLELRPFEDHQLTVRSPRHKPGMLSLRRPEPTQGNPLVMHVELTPIPGKLKVDAVRPDGFHPNQRADLYLDGRHAGRERLPYEFIGLTQETVRVSLGIEGFKPTESRVVTVKPGEVVEERFVLDVEDAWAEFRMMPSNATVMVSGRLVTENPMRLFPSVFYNIRVEAPGHLPHTEKLALTAGEVRVVSATLVPRSYVRLDLEPTNAVVFMGGRRITDPEIEIPAGRFTKLEIRAPDHHGYDTNLTLEAGESVTLSVRLRRKFFGL